jgi:hypothetical protein
MKKTNNFLNNVGCTLVIVFVITIIIMPFRIYSSLYEISSMTSPRVKSDLDAPFNQPLLRTSSRIYLERNIQKGISIDLGYLIIGELKSWNVIKLPEGSSAVIAYDNEPTKLRFNFSQFETLGGHWRSEEVRFITTGAIDQNMIGETKRKEKKWGGAFGVSSHFREVSPNFSVVVPINEIDVNGDISDRQLSILVEMDVEYPTMSGVSTYKDHQGTMDHTFNLTVLTPDEFAEYQAVKQAYFLRQLFRVLSIWVVILLGGCILLFLYYRILNRKFVVDFAIKSVSNKRK